MPNKGKRIRSKRNNPKKRNATSFAPGNQASKGVAGRKGKKPYDPDELAARIIDKGMVNRYFTLNSHLSPSQLQAKLKTPISTLEAVIIRVMVRAYLEGDHNKLDFLLDRLIGKVPNKVEVSRTNRYEGMTLEELQEEKKKLSEANQTSLRLLEDTPRVKQQERDVIDITDAVHSKSGTNSGN